MIRTTSYDPVQFPIAFAAPTDPDPTYLVLYACAPSAIPATCEAAPSGLAVATFRLADDWSTNGSGPLEAVADFAGTVAYARVEQWSACHFQATVSRTGYGGGMSMDSTVVAVGQDVQIASFTVTP